MEGGTVIFYDGNGGNQSYIMTKIHQTIHFGKENMITNNSENFQQQKKHGWPQWLTGGRLAL